jgi:tryptophanyl-tRNA synthetase
MNATRTIRSEIPYRIFSGIQPTGIPHLGNYLGALRPWVKLQNEAQEQDTLNFCVVDLHALTANHDPAVLWTQKRSMLASLLAVGLNPRRSTLFYQSDVPQHAEFMWILSCRTTVGYLSRMTQWKTKLDMAVKDISLDAAVRSKGLKLGLFSYPVLQAADVLLYNTTHVPVGIDQSQHLEFARDCATKFNYTFAKEGEEILTVPETLISPAKRVMSLADPVRKMSKSNKNYLSRILINDTPEMIYEKVRGALTDSLNEVTYHPPSRPGVSNLIEILAHLDNEFRSYEEVAKDFEGLSLGAFKGRVARIIATRLEEVRDRYETLLSPNQIPVLDRTAELGSERARLIAGRTMKRVKEAIGIS